MNYLYNGVELPDINELWTDELKKIYPYAYISIDYDSFVQGRFLVLHENPLRCVWETWATTYETLVYEGKMSFGLIELNGEWQNEIEWRYEENGASLLDIGKVQWASHDILKEDGTVYFAASDPIPVTTAEPIDPTSLLMGYRVGQLIRGMRNA